MMNHSAQTNLPIEHDPRRVFSAALQNCRGRYYLHSKSLTVTATAFRSL
ncbi:unnamed protein product [Linum tenue]|uniref:Uncharacterized protein n=1 Tax=Linum tenue TaxID=586396 RepID=A0AAV0K5U0_9ROSI|nr:unnamed protein product [Linum tenue]